MCAASDVAIRYASAAPSELLLIIWAHSFPQINLWANGIPSLTGRILIPFVFKTIAKRWNAHSPYFQIWVNGISPHKKCCPAGTIENEFIRYDVFVIE